VKIILNFLKNLPYFIILRMI